MHHTHEHSIDKTAASPVEGTPLPLRADAPDLPACDPPQKDIHKTAGGKITDFFIYQVLGFGGNASASVAMTYWINPKPEAKRVKESISKGASKLFKNVAPERSVNAVTEILFMLISGTALTAVMAPLVNRRDKIAYWMNQKLGKDTDVLPEHMQTHNAPLTLEDKVEQELKKRVTYGQTSGDLWKARWTAIWVPLVGDPALSKLNDRLEEKGKLSTDSLSWKAGQHLYDKGLSKSAVQKLGNFFKKHGASIEHMRANNPVVYNNLLKYENQHEDYNQKILGKTATPAEREDRMMIADQTRLLGKEVGWTLVLSEIVEHLTSTFQNNRIRKQEQKAIAAMQKEGIIPAGVRATTKDGHVIFTKTKDYSGPQQPSPAESAVPEESTGKKWAHDSQRKVNASPAEKTFSSHVDAVSQRAISQPQSSLV